MLVNNLPNPSGHPEEMLHTLSDEKGHPEKCTLVKRVPIQGPGTFLTFWVPYLILIFFRVPIFNVFKCLMHFNIFPCLRINFPYLSFWVPIFSPWVPIRSLIHKNLAPYIGSLFLCSQIPKSFKNSENGIMWEKFLAGGGGGEFCFCIYFGGG